MSKERSRLWRGPKAAEFDAWVIPDVEESAVEALKGIEDGGAHLLTTHQVDQLRNRVEEEAYQGGYREGLESGRTELSTRLERLDRLMQQLARPFDDLDRQVEGDLVKLACVLAQHLLRRELRDDPKQIVGSVRDCMELLPSAARNVALHLNPADSAVVREYFTETGVEPSWRVTDDPTLEPGSLRVTSDSSGIDGRLETRLNEIVGVYGSFASIPNEIGTTLPRFLF